MNLDPDYTPVREMFTLFTRSYAVAVGATVVFVLLVWLVVELCGLASGGFGAVAQPQSVPVDVSAMSPFTYTAVNITHPATHCIVSAEPGERIEVVGFALFSPEEGCWEEGWVSLHPAVDGRFVLGMVGRRGEKTFRADGSIMEYWQPAPDAPWVLPVGRDLHITCDVPLRGWVAYRKVL